MADEVAPIPTRGGMPKTFGAKLSYMIGPLLLFLVLGVAVSFAISWAFSGKFKEQLASQKKAAEKVQTELRKDLDDTEAELKTAKEKVVTLTKTVQALAKEKEKLSTGLGKAIGSLEVVSSTLQETSKGLKELNNYKKDNDLTNQTQNNNIAENTRNIVYLKETVQKRFDKITGEINQMQHVDTVLKGEYVALRNDLNTTMERGNVTESELNKLAERSKIFQLRVLTARAKEAEEAAREGDLKKLLVKLGEQ
jgi:hypothetical protein